MNAGGKILAVVAALAAAALIALSGCCLVGGNCGELAFTVRNETTESIVIIGVDDSGGEHHIDDALPGEARWIRGHLDPGTRCTSFSTLVAETEGGQIIASREEPLCNGETWVISEE